MSKERKSPAIQVRWDCALYPHGDLLWRNLCDRRRGLDLEELVQSRDAEDLHDIFIDITKDKVLAAKPIIDVDQLAEKSRVHVLHAGKANDHAWAALVNQL